MEHLVIENGKVINTDLAFEYSTVDVEATTVIDSVKNPISGKIKAKAIGELILDDEKMIPDNTQYDLDKANEACKVML